MTIGNAAGRPALNPHNSAAESRLADQVRVVGRWTSMARRVLNARQADVVRARLLSATQPVDLGNANTVVQPQQSILAVPIPSSATDWVTELCVSDVNGRIWGASDISSLCDIASALAEELNAVAERHDYARLEDSLKINYAVHKALVAASSQIIWTCDPTGKMFESNSSWEAFTGQDPLRSDGFGWLDAIHPDDQDSQRVMWAKAAGHPERITSEYRLRHVSGDWRWIQEWAVPLFSPTGELRAWVGMSVDVHERKHAEVQRAANDARYRALVEASAQIVWTTDVESRVTDSWCASWCAFTGQTSVDWENRRWLDVVHPDDRERVSRLWTERPTELAPTEYEYRLHHVSGEWRWMLERVVPLKNPSGNCIGWVGMTSDITPRKQMEIALSHSEARYRALVEAASQIVWTADADGNVLEDSPSWRAYTGRPVSEWLGDRWLNAIHPDDQSIARERWLTVVREGRPSQTEYRLRHASGHWRWVLERSVPYCNAAGHHEGWVAMAVDITDRKSAEIVLAGRERHLSLALQAARMAAWSVDFATGDMSVDREGMLLVGLQGSGNKLGDLHASMSETDAVRFDAMIEDARTTNAPLHFEYQLARASRLTWISVDGQNVGGTSGVLRGVLCDITDRKLVEERRNLLVGEIAHRGKNLLAVVQSIAAVTLVGSKSPELAHEQFLKRLASLARSHSLLTDKDWHGVPLDEIVKMEIGNLSDRVSINVSAVLLNPSAAQNCALVLHELVTNAVKYGALSVGNGRVTIRGNIQKGEDEDHVMFSWKETGGPTVKPPTRSGFGSMLLRRLINGFDTPGLIEYEPDGLRLEVAMPLSMIRPTEVMIDHPAALVFQ